MSDAEFDAEPAAVQEDLDDLDPRYLWVMEYLARHELGIAPPRDELTWWQEQAIMLVASKRQSLRDEMRDGGELDDDEMSFREAADPGEMDMSDSDLLSLAAQRKRR